MSLTTPYREQFLEADGITITFPFDDHGDGFDAISKNYVKCEIYNADGSVIVPDFTVDLSAKTITITSLTTPDGQVLNAPQNGAIVRIYRDVPETQNTTTQALQASTAQQIVQNFDNIVAMIQELQYANEHFTLRSTLPQRDLKIDLLRGIDDQKLVYWDNEKRKLVVTNYRQDEILLPADKEDILAQANAYSDEQNAVLESRINGKLTAVDAQIDANADAIQKTRDDYIAADSEIHQILNNHASELTTLRGNQASLGDQVAGIEEKIPESASGTNPLITKQQLLDEEMDIRDDLNESVSELQTQITAQATAIAGKQEKLIAGDNIVIGSDGKTISATGAGGGAGLSFIVYDTLPETGESGIIYLVPKDGAAPDIYDEYVWITATSTFELIGSTQVDLSDYATKEDLNTVLPDQTGNTGKFLTTDGSTASWSDKPLVNTAKGVASICVGGTGELTTGMFATAVGKNSYTNGGFGVAIGYNAKASASNATQVGSGTNSDANTFKVANANGNFEMMSADGTIPAGRMSATAGTTGQVLTKTDAGMEWQEASGGTTITLKEYDE